MFSRDFFLLQGFVAGRKMVDVPQVALRPGDRIEQVLVRTKHFAGVEGLSAQQVKIHRLQSAMPAFGILARPVFV